MIFSLFAKLTILCGVSPFFTLSACQVVQSFTPATVPLAVRSPYLLSFLQTTDPGPEHSKTWPTTFSGAVVGWTGLIRVDNVTYNWLGDADNIHNTQLVTKLDQVLTPTQSIFSLQAGPVNITISFLSPIEPGDPVKQSIPFSYLALEVNSLDAQPHSIVVYSDVTGEWVTGDRSQNITWTFQEHGSSMSHAISAAVQQPYNEFGAQATWGKVYYATQLGSDTTIKADSDVRTRQQFIANGTLDNQLNLTFRGIANEFPTFAFAKDFGVISSTEEPVVWALGQVRDSASTGVVLYRDLSGTPQTRSLYYTSNYTDDGTLIDDFLSDYPAALDRANKLDEKLLTAAATLGGSDYADIISIATRQAYTGTELTVGRSVDGSVNTSDVMMFMKDLGFPDNGVGNAMSPVDGLFSIFPVFMVVDPTLGGHLLEPLMRFQSSANYTNDFAAQNLGLSYPNATGSNALHSEGLEQSANMIIMAYGYMKTSGNNAQGAQYYDLLRTWANYCASNALNTTDQVSADGLKANQQSNLSLKGIIAVKAMSGISTLLGNSTDASIFSSLAQTLYKSWLEQALAADGHMLLSSGADSSSWSSGYNMFADLWLETGLLDTSVVDAQLKFLDSQLATYGIAIDSSNTSIATSHWNMLMAAVAARNASTQQAIISAVHTRASKNNALNGQFPAVFDALNGLEIKGFSSPRQGAAFAPLLTNASSVPVGNSVLPVDSQTQNTLMSSHISSATIAGSVIGALLALCSIAVLVVILRRRARQRRTRELIILNDDHEQIEAAAVISPFNGALMVADGITASSAAGGISPSSEDPFRDPRPSDVPAGMSRKMARELHYAQIDARTHAQSAASSASSSSEASTSHSARSDPVVQADVMTETRQLIDDLQGLRREMMLIRTEHSDLPPGYNAEAI